MPKEIECLFNFVLIFLIGATLIFTVFKIQETHVKMNSEVTVVELDIIDKEKDTHFIHTGTTLVPVTSYCLSVKFGDEVKNVSVTSSDYNSINTPCSSMFSVYHDDEGNLLDIELD